MKKVTLLGDSIRLGYESRVTELLKPDYEVFTYKDNGRFAAYTLRSLFDYREQIAGSDVIHWNNGHWDLCDLFGDGSFTPIGQYTDCLHRIAGLLLEVTPNVIFALTTPVRDENMHNSNAVIHEYNRAAAETLAPLGVVINDLNMPLAGDICRYVSDDLIHLTPEGYDVCAKLVADKIRAAGR